jgi:hypothetical protein
VEIKPRDQTIKNLLEAGFYKIPRFQRPYSWDRENVDDFWNDAVTSEDPDYFIGSFVLYTSKSAPDLYFIVDGQQRLTTITLLLAAIRDALHDLELSPLAAGVQKLIEREDINSELQFVLDSETPYPFFQEQIQKYGDKGPPGELGQEERALKAAYDYLSDQIRRALEAVDNDTTISKERLKSSKRDKLLSIRDRLLSLLLIAIQLGDEDHAYLIFETLNTRGKDLTVADLVKNHLTRLLKPTHKGVDIAKDKWNGILELFDSSEADINVNRFLHHAWLSRKPYTTEKKLFREIKRTVDKKSAGDFLDTLVADASVYRWVFEPQARKWIANERPIPDAIRALNLFRVVQPVPMMLAVLRAYIAGDITLKQAKSVFRIMEDFHVQFTAVTSQRTGGGTAFMYAYHARELLTAGSKDARGQVIKEFVAKLRDRVPGYEEYEAAFAELRFSDVHTKQRQLVRYILQRIDQHLRPGAQLDYELMTIEHLAPQSITLGSGVSPDAIAMLGNLLLVPEGLNNKLGAKSFEGKKKILEASDVPIDESLSEEAAWDDEMIVKRTKALARLTYDEVFKV